jgi:hypothetical protein
MKRYFVSLAQSGREVPRNQHFSSRLDRCEKVVHLINVRSLILVTLALRLLCFSGSSVAAGVFVTGGLPVQSKSEPIQASLSGAVFSASANLADGTLAGMASNTLTAARTLSSSSITFTNISGATMFFPFGSFSMSIHADYSQIFQSDIGLITESGHTVNASMSAFGGSDPATAQAIHTVTHQFDTDGTKKNTGNYLDTTFFGAQITEIIVADNELLVELLMGSTFLAAGAPLSINATLLITAGGGSNLSVTTDAANTAQLSFKLPAGVSLDDFSIDTTADLVWVTAVPVPPAVWLFGSALGILGWMRRRKTN